MENELMKYDEYERDWRMGGVVVDTLTAISAADAQAIVYERDGFGQLPSDCDWFINDTDAVGVAEAVTSWDYLFFYRERDERPTVLLVGVHHQLPIQLGLFGEAE
jgi:hypothetical protein